MNTQELAQTPLDQVAGIAEKEGIYRAFPISWTLVPYDSGSQAIHIRLAIRSQWIPGEGNSPGGWSQDWPAGYYVDHFAFVVRKGGEELNEDGVKRLGDCGIWNGDFDALQSPPPAVLVHADVQFSEYNGKSSLRAEWLNPDAEEPRARGQLRPIDESNLAAMRARFGSKTRAIANSKPAPSGSPGAPPAVQPAAATQPAVAPQPQTPNAAPATAPAPAEAPAPAPAATPASGSPPVQPAVAPAQPPADAPTETQGASAEDLETPF